MAQAWWNKTNPAEKKADKQYKLKTIKRLLHERICHCHPMGSAANTYVPYIMIAQQCTVWCLFSKALKQMACHSTPSRACDTSIVIGALLTYDGIPFRKADPNWWHLPGPALATGITQSLNVRAPEPACRISFQNCQSIPTLFQLVTWLQKTDIYVFAVVRKLAIHSWLSFTPLLTWAGRSISFLRF